jgi:hypothetical protein
MIVGVSGLIGSGKDTVAEYLVNNKNYHRISMAGILKDTASVLFGWDREVLEGKTPESRKEREVVDTFWSERLGFEFSPRIALQLLGTDIFRNNFHEDIWVIAAERGIVGKENVVISDIRFANEAKMIKRLNGKLWRVKRGEEPEWWGAAKNNKDIMESKFKHIHYSEWAWANINFDSVIENDDTLESLYNKIERLFNI